MLVIWQQRVHEAIGFFVNPNWTWQHKRRHLATRQLRDDDSFVFVCLVLPWLALFRSSCGHWHWHWHWHFHHHHHCCRCCRRCCRCRCCHLCCRHRRHRHHHHHCHHCHHSHSHHSHSHSCNEYCHGPHHYSCYHHPRKQPVMFSLLTILSINQILDLPTCVSLLDDMYSPIYRTTNFS